MEIRFDVKNNLILMEPDVYIGKLIYPLRWTKESGKWLIKLDPFTLTDRSGKKILEHLLGQGEWLTVDIASFRKAKVSSKWINECNDPSEKYLVYDVFKAETYSKLKEAHRTEYLE